MISVSVNFFYAVDWHDWTEYSQTIKYKNGVDIPKDKIMPVIARNIKKIIKCPAGTIEAALKENEHEFINEDNYSVKLSKTSYGYSLRIIDNEAECNIDYHIKEIPDDKVVYLPVREYITAPKVTAGVQRCFTPYFTSYEEAVKAMKTLPNPPKGIFRRQKSNLIVDNVDDLEDDLWYINNITMIESDPELKNWHPVLTEHARRTGAI